MKERKDGRGKERKDGREKREKKGKERKRGNGRGEGGKAERRREIREIERRKREKCGHVFSPLGFWLMMYRSFIFLPPFCPPFVLGKSGQPLLVSGLSDSILL